MGWPQYTYMGLMIFGIGYGLSKDGQPKTGKHSFLADLIAQAVITYILYAGGFFGAH